MSSSSVLKISLVAGKVLDFVYRVRKDKSEVIAVIVQFDDEKIGQDLRKEHLNLHEKVKNQNGVPIFRRRCEYRSQNKSGTKKRGKDLWVKQFPLVLAFASTGKIFSVVTDFYLSSSHVNIKVLNLYCI